MKYRYDLLCGQTFPLGKKRHLLLNQSITPRIVDYSGIINSCKVVLLDLNTVRIAEDRAEDKLQNVDEIF